MRGAFVLFEGLAATVIDSQVLRHVRLVRERLGIDMTVFAFACDDALFRRSEQRLAAAQELAGGPVKLARGVRPAMPLARAINRGRLRMLLDADGPLDFIHARGDHTAAVAAPLSLPMLWDCRGDGRAELRERFAGRSRSARLLAEVRIAMMDAELRAAGAGCAAACFVTDELRDEMRGHLRGQPTFVLPCLAPEETFCFDPGLRARMRASLGYAEDQQVYVYSGGLSAYQCFPETVALFRNLAARDARARLLVLTPQIEEARARLSGVDPAVAVCRAARHDEINAFLNAADFGFMLRETTPVNHVAFPTKFAEYAMAGLTIIMNPLSPPACVRIASQLGLDVKPHELPIVSRPLAERTRIAAEAAVLLGRSGRMSSYSTIYRSLARARPAAA